MQWVGIAEHKAAYKQIRLKASGPGSFSLKKLDFKFGWSWVERMVKEHAQKCGDEGKQQN